MEELSATFDLKTKYLNYKLSFEKSLKPETKKLWDSLSGIKVRVETKEYDLQDYWMQYDLSSPYSWGGPRPRGDGYSK